MYKIIGVKTLKDEEGNEEKCEIRDYGLSQDELEDELFSDDLKFK